MMITRLLAALFCLTSLPLFAQKKALDHADIPRWKKIEQTAVSNDGRWVANVFSVVTEGDPVLQLWNSQTGDKKLFQRGTDGRFSEDNLLLVFKIKPALDSLKAQKRRKVKEEDQSKDSLGIYDLQRGTLEKIPNVKQFTVPEKWSGWLVYQLETWKAPPVPKDTAKTVADTSKAAKPAETAKPVAKGKEKKPKKENKDNGWRLIVRHTASGRQDTLAYVQNYQLAKKGKRLLWQTSGKGDTLAFPVNVRTDLAGVYWMDLETTQTRPLLRGKGKYPQLALDETGLQAAFVADLDTTKARIRPYQLFYWKQAPDSARAVAGANAWLPFSDPPQWLLSDQARPQFSEDGSKLYFGLAQPPVLNDTTLLPEEIVHVEVWSHTQSRLYTEQKVRLDADKKRSYPAVWHIAGNTFAQLGAPELPELRFQEQRNAPLALGFTEEPYVFRKQWDGEVGKDVYAVDVRSGARELILKDRRCKPALSPEAGYIAWWNAPDSSWYAWNTAKGQTKKLTDNLSVPFYDEENDVPDLPDEYGVAGWIKGDVALLVYDRFDIWNIDPAGLQAPARLTHGRETETVYRYLKLDPEERSIAPDARLLLHRFDERNKSEGYVWLDLKTGVITPWMNGSHAYTRQPKKARNANVLVFSKENYQEFPDLWYTGYDDKAAPRRVTEANPQQKEYNWGTIELAHWTSLTGEKVSGLLVKPEGFDPARQYPMIVYFYEKLTDGLHAHRTPDYHRSSINFTFYASRGYLVFAPDIHYKTGYPGESAYDAIVSGVTMLMDRGYVDRERIGLQGHSWGGYQSAYLVTRTNLFRCAESGAPVANMTSAYGGIRWESGLSRMFQYEHQQSRIGGTLWEYPMRYLENSPLFSLDKVQTPVLILHNDKDGAVPWYQGIELFSGLRRLGKPAWLLNYNDEPHWPLKLQNRIDFQTRMAQFFDHYLLDKPQPRWMLRGVPPLEKGILQGLELEKE